MAGVDLVTRLASGAVVQSWYRGGPRLGSTDLGGDVVAQHAVSLGDGTLDVFAVSRQGVALRQHWDKQRWSGWVDVGGRFTSGLSASADPARKVIVVSGRGADGATYEREFTPTAAMDTWRGKSDGLSALVRPRPRRHLARGRPARGRCRVRRAGGRAARVPRGRHDRGVELRR